MNCIICDQQASQTVYDKSKGSVSPVCISHANQVFEFGSNKALLDKMTLLFGDPFDTVISIVVFKEDKT